MGRRSNQQPMGKTLFFLGLLLLVYARFFMETTVATPLGHIYNIGLLEQQRSLTLIALVLIVLNGRTVGINARSARKVWPKAIIAQLRKEEPDAAATQLSAEARRAKRAFRYKAFASTLLSLFVGAPAGALAAVVIGGLLVLLLGMGLLESVLLPALPLTLLASIVGVFAWAFRSCAKQQRILQVLKWDAAALVIASAFQGIEFSRQPDFSGLVLAGVLAFGALGTLYLRENLKEVPI